MEEHSKLERYQQRAQLEFFGQKEEYTEFEIQFSEMAALYYEAQKAKSSYYWYKKVSKLKNWGFDEIEVHILDWRQIAVNESKEKYTQLLEVLIKKLEAIPKADNDQHESMWLILKANVLDALAREKETLEVIDDAVRLDDTSIYVLYHRALQPKFFNSFTYKNKALDLAVISDIDKHMQASLRGNMNTIGYGKKIVLKSDYLKKVNDEFFPKVNGLSKNEDDLFERIYNDLKDYLERYQDLYRSYEWDDFHYHFLARLGFWLDHKDMKKLEPTLGAYGRAGILGLLGALITLFTFGFAHLHRGFRPTFFSSEARYKTYQLTKQLNEMVTMPSSDPF